MQVIWQVINASFKNTYNKNGWIVSLTCCVRSNIQQNPANEFNLQGAYLSFLLNYHRFMTSNQRAEVGSWLYLCI